MLQYSFVCVIFIFIEKFNLWTILYIYGFLYFFSKIEDFNEKEKIKNNQIT